MSSMQLIKLGEKMTPGIFNTIRIQIENMAMKLNLTHYESIKSVVM